VTPDANSVSTEGYLATGFIAMPFDQWQFGVTHLAPDGGLLWANTYGDTLDGDGSYAILQLPGGGIYAAGVHGQGSTQAALACADAMGDLSWVRTYRPYRCTGHDPRVFRRDGQCWARYPSARRFGALIPGPVSYCAMVMAVDTLGTVNWFADHLSTGVVVLGRRHRAHRRWWIGNGRYRAHDRRAGDHDVRFQAGCLQVIWSGRSCLISVRLPLRKPWSKAAGGDLFVTGTAIGADNDIYWLRLSASGAVLNARYCGTPEQDAGMDMIATSDGNFVITGYTHPAGAARRISWKACS
jgi:hypothetical protein